MSQRRTNNKRIGVLGEKLAAGLYQNMGFSILAQNWRFGNTGELDLIAYHPEDKTLCFVEVKTRIATALGNAAEAVTPKKQQQIIGLANRYLSSAGFDEVGHIQEIQFDVVAICFNTEALKPSVQRYPKAFTCD
ncbi:MAG: YraN family protein [Cyanobacteria bacterium P01_H01_bin.74]